MIFDNYQKSQFKCQKEKVYKKSWAPPRRPAYIHRKKYSYPNNLKGQTVTSFLEMVGEPAQVVSARVRGRAVPPMVILIPSYASC